MSKYRHWKRQWWLTGSLGALFFGSGLCASIECGFLKHEGASWSLWVPLGTLALACTVAGLVLLLKSIKMEVFMHYDRSKDSKKS
ncbi:hypothetical protein [Croceiramulus getboli]|nr:hypothetical protein P8624_11960 [Flavobacteriaceae bacterium YJPT1-3]